MRSGRGALKNAVALLVVCLGIGACTNDTFEPFEFFFSITSEQAVVISLLPGDGSIQMRTRVYPEDGQLGIGEVAARDDLRTLSVQEADEVQRLFQAVEFNSLGSEDYIPPLDASLWAVNTRETAGDYFTVLEPGEATEERNLTQLIALGTYLWNLAGVEGSLF